MLCKNCGRHIDVNINRCKCGINPFGEDKNDFSIIERILSNEDCFVMNEPINPPNVRDCTKHGRNDGAILDIDERLEVSIDNGNSFEPAPEVMAGLPAGDYIFRDKTNYEHEFNLTIEEPKSRSFLIAAIVVPVCLVLVIAVGIIGLPKLSVSLPKDDRKTTSSSAVNTTKKEIKKKMVVTVDTYLTFRSDPSIPDIDSENKIGEIPNNEEVDWINNESKFNNNVTFYHIYYKGDDGWVNSQYLTKPNVESETVTSETTMNEIQYIKCDKDKEYIPMYNDADIESEVIKKFTPDGSKSVQVKVIGEEDGFYRIKYGSKTGYIKKENLTKLKQKSTSATTTTARVIVTQPPTTSYQNNYNNQSPKPTSSPKAQMKVPGMD